MAGQIIESSFGNQYASTLSNEVADAFGRAQAIQANLQSEQARNALTQQQIQIQQANQQTNQQLAQAEVASYQTRTQLLQKLMPSEVAKAGAEARIAGAQADALPGKYMSEAQAASDAHLLASGNIAMQGVDQKKAELSLAYATPLIKNQLLMSAATIDHLAQQTESMKQASVLQLQQTKHQEAMDTLQLVGSGLVSPEQLGKAKALDTSGMLSLIDPEMIGNPTRIRDAAIAKAASHPDTPEGKIAMQYLLSTGLAEHGVPMDKANPLAGMTGKDGKPLVGSDKGPVQSLIDNFGSALGEIKKRQQAGTTTQPSGAGAAASTEEEPSFDFQKTGNPLVDAAGYHATQHQQVAGMTMGGIEQALPAVARRATDMMAQDPSGAHVEDGKIVFDSGFEKQLKSMYGASSSLVSGGKGSARAQVASPERQVVDQALVVDPDATVPQQVVYNATVNEVLKQDLTSSEGVKKAHDLAMKASANLTAKQGTMLGNLIKSFK